MRLLKVLTLPLAHSDEDLFGTSLVFDDIVLLEGFLLERLLGHSDFVHAVYKELLHRFLLAF